MVTRSRHAESCEIASSFVGFQRSECSVVRLEAFESAVACSDAAFVEELVVVDQWYSISLFALNMQNQSS